MSNKPQNIRSFLDDLLAGGQDLLRRGEDLAAQKLGVGDDPAERERMRKTALAGGAAAATLGVLLGTRTGRSLTRTGLVLGGLGMLGKVAYDAYAGTAGTAANQAGQIGDLSGPAAERRAIALTTAVIAAAKADGHIDAAERARIEEHLNRLPEDVRELVGGEIARPLDPGHVAALADSPQAAREIYAVSVLVTGADDPHEEAYLADLARALGLDAAECAAIAEAVTGGA